jgi:hypothetical protein
MLWVTLSHAAHMCEGPMLTQPEEASGDVAGLTPKCDCSLAACRSMTPLRSAKTVNIVGHREPGPCRNAFRTASPYFKWCQ